MQSSSLSGPQGILSLKFHEQCNANKVSKNPLGEFGKLVGVLGGVRNNSYELRNEIKSTGRIDSGEKRLRIDSIDREIRVTKKEVGKLNGENSKNREKILRFEQDIRWANTSDSDFESIRNKRRKRANERIAKAQERYEHKISKKDRDIQSLTNSKDRAVEHASNHGVAVRSRLNLAIAGEIYDPKNTGFGPMWSSHIQSDEFAMKEFGFIEGYGKYGERIKVPNAEGEMWKILVKDFMGSPAKLDKLQSDKAKLEKGYRQLAELMTRDAEIPDKKISEQEITEINNSISTFKKENENREKIIKEFKVSISKLEQERMKLFEEILVLQSPAS